MSTKDHDPRVIIRENAGADGARLQLREDRNITRAVEAAMIDPTERDLLEHKPRDATRRVGRAIRELWRASIGLMATLLARLILGSATRAVVKQRGEVPGAEITVCALERVLSGWFYRKVLRPANVLRMFGAHRSETYEGDAVYSLPLTSRSYGGFYPGGVEAPRARAAVGVRFGPGKEPVWIVKRFARAQAGNWKLDPRVESHDTTGKALLSYYKDVPADHIAARVADHLVRMNDQLAKCDVPGVADIVSTPGEPGAGAATTESAGPGGGHTRGAGASHAPTAAA